MVLAGLGVGPSPTVFANTAGCPAGFARDKNGLCRDGALVYVPPSVGVSIDAARNACAVAKGIWDEGTGTCGVYDTEVPASCNLLETIFGGCKVPGTAGELQAVDSGQYTNYKIAQSNPEVAAENVAANEASAEEDIARLRANCAYAAAADYPVLSNVITPELVCQLRDPFNSPGWLIYAALGVGAYLLLKGLKN